jgi:hypothetical protein
MAAEEIPSPGSEFRRWLEAASYHELRGEPLEAVLAQAAAERTLVDEVGALRITLTRLLLEEDDVGRLATSVARVAAVAVRAAQVRSATSTERTEDLQAQVLQSLVEQGKG